MPDLYTVVLAGGSGTRFWPLSREEYPKQFMTVFDSRSMFRMTMERALSFAPPEKVRIVTIKSQLTEVNTVISDLGLQNTRVLAEPSGRNTAAAIGLAAFDIAEADPSAVIVVLPSDHFVRDGRGFANLVRKAAEAAARDWIVTLGLKPTRPETGYGYIRRGALLGIPGADEAFAAVQFAEKPDLERAAEYVRSGEYFWNSGMFIFRAGLFFEEMKKLLPDHYEALRQINSLGDPAAERAQYERIYSSIEKISVDYGIMEKSERVAVIPADIGWSDVGSWKALYDILEKHIDGNVLHGDSEAIESRNSLIWSDHRLVAALGIEDLAVVETADAVLVCPLSRSQEVRSVAERLLKLGRRETVSPLKVAKPWGAYMVMERAESYQVKRLDIEPGRRMSLQSHECRSEHWIVVEGTASVTLDGQTLEIPQGGDIRIPRRARHRVENTGSLKLRIIEIQTGAYLGEDDIIRYEDDYGRAQDS